MSVSPVCPRCGEQLVVRPGSSAQAWCHVHGAVTPLHHTVLVAHDAISAVTADARVLARTSAAVRVGIHAGSVCVFFETYRFTPAAYAVIRRR